MARDLGRLRSALRDYLPGGEAITAVVPLSTGHSNETYLLEGLDHIVRLPPSEEGLLPPYDMARQHQVISAVAAADGGPPVPTPVQLCLDPSVVGDPFFTMLRVPGAAFEMEVPDWLQAADAGLRAGVCAQWIEAITAVHRLPVATFTLEPRTPVQDALHWLDVARRAEAPAQLIALLTDLTANPPAPSGPPTPLHGDPKSGNCLWEDGRLTALLDWELAGVGDPLTDLGYLLQFFPSAMSPGQPGFDLPGWWSREQTIAAWQTATGREPVDLPYYEALGMAKVAAILSTGAFLFRSGRASDLRFAAWEDVLVDYATFARIRFQGEVSG